MERKYRFPTNFEPPVAPPGMEVTKFHGDVAFISSPVAGEVPNAAGFTPTQVKDLVKLETARTSGELEVRPTHVLSINIVELPTR